MGKQPKVYLTIGITGFVLGAALAGWSADISLALTRSLGAGAETGMSIINYFLQILRLGLMPLCAVFIGVAIILNALERRDGVAAAAPRQERTDAHESS